MDLADYYQKVGYLRASGFFDDQAHALAENLFDDYQNTKGERVMRRLNVRHLKNRIRLAEHIDVHHPRYAGRVLEWLYKFGPHEIGIFLSLCEDELAHPDLIYVDGVLLPPLSRWEEEEDVESRYGLKTRLQLLKKYRDVVVANKSEGLAMLRQAATAMGLCESNPKTILTEALSLYAKESHREFKVSTDEDKGLIVEVEGSRFQLTIMKA